MFSKILIANRGEIALRIIRACHELGVQTVAVYSEADRDCLHVRFADEAICIGGAPSSESYLNVPRIISAAEVTDAEAIHPGYGFLAEMPHFAEICNSCGIAFVGPSAQSMQRMGDKAEARQRVAAAGVPTIPGSDGPVADPAEALKFARGIGFPVMIKACSGGGGKGMRLIHTEAAFMKGFSMAQIEAEMAFGDGRLYMEKLVQHARHIEFQVLADSHGNAVHLGERDCSLQRRHQKLIEEGPSPALSPELREKMGSAAVACTKAADYVNAGTIEFLLTADGNFYFMEMNTRIQVEHPVTEMITGIDLVKAQLRIAAGEELGFTQDDIKVQGHAIECRINAEDTSAGFRPSPGKITALHLPGGPGIRIDTHIYAEYNVPPHYDSLLAKVLAYGRTREEAIARMKRCLNEFVVEGIHTTAPFHLRLLDTREVLTGETHTGFVEQMLGS